MRAITGSTRTIWIMAVTAVVSLAAGLGLSHFIVSPSEAAANAAPPPAGPITVPVEQRTLANDVVMRGDAIYEDPVQVTIETGDIGGPAVVTGQVPEVGANLDAGAVMLEITGRPVILLAGELPVYRTLRTGVSGPDVTQLKAALLALGIDPGNAGSTTYDTSTAAAVRELYARVGYPAPTAGEEADATLAGAREMVRSAEEQVAAAQRALTASTSGASAVERLAADNAIRAAQREAGEGQTELDSGEDVNGDSMVATARTVDDLLDVVNLRLVERDALLAPRDTSELRAAVASAQRALADAKSDLTKAQNGVVTPLPASEIVYLTNTPRRVDDVTVRRGSMIAGTAVMSVSGATLQIAGTVATIDADLIAEGAAVVITLPDGTDVTGTVQSVGVEADDVTGQATDPNRKRVVVAPDELTEDQRATLQGANVKVSIPVSSTEGDVLAVPIAALTAGPGGESRVEVLDEGADETRLVTVETGLAAGGMVEVTPIDGSLEVGDQVVVGTAEVPQGNQTDGTETPTDEPTATTTEDAQG